MHAYALEKQSEKLNGIGCKLKFGKWNSMDLMHFKQLNNTFVQSDHLIDGHEKVDFCEQAAMCDGHCKKKIGLKHIRFLVAKKPKIAHKTATAVE